MVLLIGNKGNMGQRYSCILRHLGIPFRGFDLGDERTVPIPEKKVIIATPTKTHVELLKYVDQWSINRPDVLCEKPVVQTLRQLDEVKSLKNITPYSVNQYQYLFGVRRSHSKTEFNYFKHGNDGLAWDCFQIITLSTTEVDLKEDSPLWKCQIDDLEHNLQWMDLAYVDMIKDFVGPMKQMWGIEKLEEGTIKVLNWIKSHG